MNRVMRILIAEEDQDFIAMITTSLLQAGDEYHVEAVSSGDDCLKRLKGEKYDILLLDHSLPDGNGLEWLRRFNKMGIGIPTVFEVQVIHGIDVDILQVTHRHLGIVRRIQGPALRYLAAGVELEHCHICFGDILELTAFGMAGQAQRVVPVGRVGEIIAANFQPGRSRIQGVDVVTGVAGELFGFVRSVSSPSYP